MANSKPSGLGRGLDSIFYDNSTPDAAQTGGSRLIKLSEIEPRKGQPRKNFEADALAGLATSIAEVGVISPIVVREVAGGFYQIIAGERRWRASKMAGLTEIPAIVLEADDQRTSELAVIENVQRQDLNPVEEAAAYRDLMDDYGMTQETVSRRVGKSRSTIANALRLLDLPDAVQAQIASGALTAGHAKALLGLWTKADIPYVADQAAKNGFSVRETENLIKKLNNASAKKEEKGKEPREQKFKVDHTAYFEQQVTEHLGYKVKIDEAANKMEIFYNNNESLDVLIMKICGGIKFKF